MYALSLPLSPPSESDHQQAVKRQCEQLMEFQGKMKEACVKFESLEEEHLAQMSTFMLKMARVRKCLNDQERRGGEGLWVELVVSYRRTV